MRIIHTSDWHLGQKFYGYDRFDEHAAALLGIKKACLDHRPDALVVSGDIFDNDHPAAADLALLADFMVELKQECQDMAVIVTAGNHDSGTRIVSHASLYNAIGVDIVGRAAGDEYDPYIIDIGTGVVAAIPYYIARDFSTAALLEEAGRVAGDRPVVAMAHDYVTGADITGHGRRMELVGNREAVTAERFGPPGSYDYLALGHIHRPQWVGQSGRVRYSGSIVQVSFDEMYGHSVSLVTIERRGSLPEVREIATEILRPAVTLPAKGALAAEEAVGLIASLPDDMDCYIRLNVVADAQLPPTVIEDARRAAEGKKARLCLVNPVRRAVPGSDDEDGADEGAMTVDRFRDIAPIEIARRYAAMTGTPLSDDMEKMFDEIVSSLDNDTRNETA